MCMFQVEKFYRFQTTLYELSTLAEALPQDGCHMLDDDNATTAAPKLSPKPDKVKVSLMALCTFID